MTHLLSICIPSYNRVEELKRLLNSIDTVYSEEVEIVIREDQSPKRQQIREMVFDYKKNSAYIVNYIENETNYGYDKNIRNSAKAASGLWVMFMGDDDILVPGELDHFLDFLRKHDDLGYVLRRYQSENKAGIVEEYRYSDKDEFLKSGEDAVVEFFRRSVFISGFTYRKQCFEEYDCVELDGTLLFQLYIQASICLKYSSAYCDIPITKSLEGGIPYFGKAEAEKELYESGRNTFQNSINFLKQIRVVTDYFDKKNNTEVTKRVLKSYSKYSYGYLLEHRDEGVRVFRRYAKETKKLGLGDSFYFYVYYIALLIFGRDRCQSIIRWLKGFLGHTPRL